MNVTFASDLLVPPLSGVGRYGYELASELKRNAALASLSFISYRGPETWAQIQQRLLAQPDQSATAAGVWPRVRSRIVNTRLGSIGYSAVARAQYGRVNTDSPDSILHLPTLQVVPQSPRLAQLHTVVTVHDLSHRFEPAWHPRERCLRLERALQSLRGADAVIAVSQFTADALIDQKLVYPRIVRVVHNGVSNVFNAHASPLPASARKQVICVGTIEPRKNVETLLRAYSTLPPRLLDEYPLLLVGEYGWSSKPIHALMGKLQRNGWLRYAGHIPDATLALEYARSRLCVYPSRYEGFGLPVLEALAAGTPVIAGNHSSIPEVAGGHATLIENVAEVDELREAIVAELECAWDGHSAELRASHAASFTWQRCAEKTVDVYRSLTVAE
jgi:glycosyltransferase involved in cell wall biosynthesis